MLLDHIQAAGYRILHTGIATLPRRSTRRAWMECRKYESPDEDVTEDMDVDVDRDECEEFTLSCEQCGEEFMPDEARTIAIFGPSEIRYTCPQCGHGTDGPPPVGNDE
jgi:rRNA maturation protein Nop10